jgi:hypothetical protein
MHWVYSETLRYLPRYRNDFSEKFRICTNGLTKKGSPHCDGKAGDVQASQGMN